MILYVWIFNHTNKLLKEIDEIRPVETHLVSQNRYIKSQIAKLSRADRIKEIATSKLHMTTPSPETLAVIINPVFAEKD